MLIGLTAGLFFSATFVLNRAMSLEGGHWFWSASLRYAYMLVFLSLGLTAFRGPGILLRCWRELYRNRWFWMLAGSVGFGGFYSLICLAADHAPAWVVATTWQLTIIATLVVLMLFGRRFPRAIWCCSALVFSGISLVNLSGVRAEIEGSLLAGALAVLVAALCYPLGNQLVWEAQSSGWRRVQLDSALVANPFVKVLLMSAGSLPFWLLLYPLVDAGLPSSGQLVNVALVALSSGVVATTLFLYARGQATDATTLAAVDATQSSEVLFALVGEVLFLGAPPPTLAGMIGIVVTAVGLAAFVRFGR